MADQLTNYVIQVADKVDPAIGTKLDGITASATRAGDSCTTLQASLDKINASGLTSVSTALRDSGTAQRSLNTSTSTYARNAATATANTDKYAASLAILATKAQDAWVKVTALSGATGQYVVGARAIAAAANNNNPFAPIAQGAGAATAGTRQMNAALGVARGNITSANRLAGSFLATLIGSGPIVQAAFSALGALALVAVIVQMVQAIDRVIEAYKRMSVAAIAADTAAILSGEKLLKVKQASIFSAEGIARLASGSPGQEQIEVVNVAARLKEIDSAKQIEAAQARNNEAGLTGVALAKQRTEDAKKALSTLQQERIETEKLTQSIIKQKNATVQVKTQGYTTMSGVYTPGQEFTVAKIVDPTQQKALGDALRQSVEHAHELDTAIKVATIDIDTMGKREPLAGIKEAAKNAAEEMRNLNAQYQNYIGGLNRKPTANESLKFWEDAEKGLKYYSDNIDKVNAKENPFKEAIGARNNRADAQVDQLKDQVGNLGLYNDTLKESAMLEKMIQEIKKTGIPLTATEIAQRKELIATVVEGAAEQAALNAEYNAANGPLDNYTAHQSALIDLWADGAITSAQFERQMNLANKSYTDAVNPMAEYQRGLTNQTALLGIYGQKLVVATELQQQQERLRNLGYSDSQIAAQTAGLERQLTVMEQQKAINQDVAAIYANNAGALERLTTAQLANNKALAENLITQRQYKEATLDNAIAQNNLQNAQGNGNFASHVKEMLSALKDARPLAQQAQDAFTGFFSTLNSGFADSIGHVIAYGGSVKSALLDTARQAVSGLISSLIKLGIQYLITTALMKLFNIQLPKDSNNTAKDTVKNTGLAIASIAAITAAEYVAIDLLQGPAWSLAEAISLISFGANAAGATAGIAAVIAAGSAGTKKFAAGGRVTGPGTSTSDSVPALLSNGEYVISASAYAAHSAAVEAINHGARTVYSVANSGASVGSTSGSSGSMLNLNVIHDGSTQIQVVRGTSPDEVQVIARNMVYAHADDAIGKNLPNPNSQTRKALKQHTNVRGQD